MKLFVLIGGVNWFLRDLLAIWRQTHDVRIFAQHRDTTKAGFLWRKIRAYQNIRAMQTPEVRRNYAWSDLTFIEWAGYATQYVTHQVDGTTPIIIRVHGIPRGPNARHFRKTDFAKVTNVIVLTESIRQRIAQTSPNLAEKLVVIPGTVREDFFHTPLDSTRTRKIAVVARLSPEKRLDLILQAMQRLEGKFLHIAGDGALYEELQHLAQELGLVERVSFEGWIPNEHLPLWLADKDLLINASEREGCPFAILEAMASGVTPFIRGWGGAQELFPGSFVLRYPDADFIDHLVLRIRLFYEVLTEAEVVQLRQLAREWAREFQVKKVIARYEQLFQDIVGGS